jgi:predicted nucleotidyltransferase
MNARPILEKIARALNKHRLEAVLIGNAAAALQGAPVTTLDFDFMFRKTPTNLRKLKAVARELGAVVFRPYYPVSDLYRIVNDDAGLQIDLMPRIHGVRSFEAVRSRSTVVQLGRGTLHVAALEDIIKSKRAANRPRDRAVLPVLQATLREKKDED